MEDKSNKKIVLLITTLGAFIVPFMVSSINVALPSISKEFVMNTVLLNWVVLSFMLSIAVFILPFGRVADIFGRKKLLLYGISGYTVASILCGISFDTGMLIASRVLQGISGAIISVTIISMLSSVYFQGERGRALGINVAATYIGLSSGPFLGGFLTKYLGWRSIFFLVVPVGIIIIIILLNLKQDWAEAKGEDFDYKGSIIYGVSLFAVIYGFSLIRSFWGITLILIGFILMIIFGFYENRVKNPILNMTLIKNNKILIFSSLAALINYSATFVVGYLLSLYLQYIKGFEPQQAGLILVAQLNALKRSKKLELLYQLMQERENRHSTRSHCRNSIATTSHLTCTGQESRARLAWNTWRNLLVTLTLLLIVFTVTTISTEQTQGGSHLQEPQEQESENKRTYLQ